MYNDVWDCAEILPEKHLDVALNITGVKKPLGKLAVAVDHSVRTLHEWSTRLRNGLARILARSDGTITGLC